MKLFTFCLLTFCLTHLSGAQNLSAHIEALAGDDAQARLKARDAIFADFAQATAPGADAGKSTALESEALALIKGDALPLSERLYILKMLERFGSTSVGEAVNPLLGDSSSHIRDSARKVLLALPGQQAETYLLTGLERGAEDDQAAYIDALAMRDAVAAAPAIAEHLESSNPELVAAAAVALGKLGNPVVVPQLLAARKTSSGASLARVESALLKIGLEDSLAAELAKNGCSGSIRAEAFGQLIPQDVSQAKKILQVALNDKSFAGRLRLIEKALQSGSPALQQKVIELLEKGDTEEKIIIAARIGAEGLGQFEGKLLALLPKSEAMLRTAIIRALGTAGGEASFKVLFDAFVKNSKDANLKEALAKVQAPESDAKALMALEKGTESRERIAAMQVLELRNVEGATARVNTVAQETADAQLREAAFKTLESIGDEKSLELLLDFISEGDESAVAAQRSLKRLSANFGNPGYQWEKFYEPVLTSADSDAVKGRILQIVDSVACSQVLAILTQVLLDPQMALREAALQSLRRWPLSEKMEEGSLWVLVAETEFSTEQERSAADRALKKLLTAKGHQFNIGQADLIVEIVQSNIPRESKRDLLGVYEDPAKHFFKHRRSAVTKRLKPYFDDPDVGYILKKITDAF